ncbi:hypothetical protein V8G54_009473 [Vigna mungo]|uniref:Uncharacterized protein n=1 Tax=Vigna mungo TaxID=3915 RepID=A0AAQ3NWS9_VIGMU
MSFAIFESISFPNLHICLLLLFGKYLKQSTTSLFTLAANKNKKYKCAKTHGKRKTLNILMIDEHKIVFLVGMHTESLEFQNDAWTREFEDFLTLRIFLFLQCNCSQSKLWQLCQLTNFEDLHRF